MRILFLGHDHNPISVECLSRLLEENAHEIMVGINDQKGENIFKTVREIIRKHGLVFLLQKARDSLVSSGRLALRKLGVSLRDYRSIKELLADYPCASFSCKRINSADSVKKIESYDPELIVVAVFGQILKPAILDIPSKGCINVHASLLPKYRGPNPFYWVLHNMERNTGVTIHYMDEGIDTGDIIMQAEILIARDETEFTLRAKCAKLGSELLVQAVSLIEEGSAPRIKQKEMEASYNTFPPRGASRL